MRYMMPAQAFAQLLSLIVLATAARWYLVPWLKNRTRADALIALLRYRVRLAVPLAWLLALETVYDTITNIQGGVREHLMGAASGVTWMVLTYFVPMVVVSCVLLIWQLYARRGEALDPALGRAPRPQAASVQRAS